MPRSARRDVQRRIDKILADVHGESGVPGLVIAVEMDGARYFSAAGVARNGDGTPLSRDARFDVSCLMKFFLSVTALRLAAREELDLRAPVETMLPELAAPAHRDITPIHLMSHSSGYHGLDITDMAVRWNSKWEAFAARFRGAAQLFAPGTTFNYEHSEHVILGEVLRKASGQGPITLVHEAVLAAAGVRLCAAGDENGTAVSSHAFSPKTGGFAPVKLPPFGPFWEASLPDFTITVDDVVSAVAAVIADGALAEALRTPLVSLPEMAASSGRAERAPRQFSAACAVYDDGILGHNGSMFGQTVGFRFDKRSGTIAAVGVNAWSPHARDTALRRTLDFLAGIEEAPATANAEPAQPLVHTRERLMSGLSNAAVAGHYIGSYLGQVAVEQDGSGLHCTVGPPGNRQSGFAIAAEGEDFTIQSRMPVSLHFCDGGQVLFLGVHAYKKNCRLNPR